MNGFSFDDELANKAPGCIRWPGLTIAHGRDARPSSLQLFLIAIRFGNGLDDSRGVGGETRGLFLLLCLYRSSSERQKAHHEEDPNRQPDRYHRFHFTLEHSSEALLPSSVLSRPQRTIMAIDRPQVTRFPDHKS